MILYCCVGRGTRVAVDQKLLREILQEIRKIEIIDIVNTYKNREARFRHGITILEQEDMIRSLTEVHYHSGPEPDHDLSKMEPLWIFKKPFRNLVFYIKIKIVTKSNGVRLIKCLSCHVDYE